MICPSYNIPEVNSTINLCGGIYWQKLLCMHSAKYKVQSMHFLPPGKVFEKKLLFEIVS